MRGNIDKLVDVDFPNFDDFKSYVSDIDEAQLHRDVYEKLTHVRLNCEHTAAVDSMVRLNSGVTLNWNKIARDARKQGCIVIQDSASELLVSVYSEHCGGERVFKIASHLVHRLESD